MTNIKSVALAYWHGDVGIQALRNVLAKASDDDLHELCLALEPEPKAPLSERLRELVDEVNELELAVERAGDPANW